MQDVGCCFAPKEAIKALRDEGGEEDTRMQAAATIIAEAGAGDAASEGAAPKGPVRGAASSVGTSSGAHTRKAEAASLFLKR